jgi:hypothetical protein
MKKLINQIKLTLSRVFGSFLNFLVERGNVAVKVTDIVKSFIENPAVDLVVSLTPTKKDDLILMKAKKLIPKVSLQIGMAMAIISEAEAAENEAEAFSKVLAYVSSNLPEDGKAIFYRELSGRVAEALSDGTVSTAEAISIVQLIFKKVL